MQKQHKKKKNWRNLQAVEVQTNVVKEKCRNGKIRYALCSTKENAATRNCTLIPSSLVDKDYCISDTTNAVKMYEKHSMEENANNNDQSSLLCTAVSSPETVAESGGNNRYILHENCINTKKEVNKLSKEAEIKLRREFVGRIPLKGIESDHMRKLTSFGKKKKKNHHAFASKDHSLPVRYSFIYHKDKIGNNNNYAKTADKKCKNFIQNSGCTAYNNIQLLPQAIQVPFKENTAKEVITGTSLELNPMVDTVVKEELQNNSNDIYFYETEMLNSSNTELKNDEKQADNLNVNAKGSTVNILIDQFAMVQNMQTGENVEQQNFRKYGLLTEKDYLENFAIGDIPLEYWGKVCKSYDCFNGSWQVNVERSDTLQYILRELGFGSMKRRVMESHRSIADISLRITDNPDTPVMSIVTYLPMQVVKQAVVKMNCSYVDTPDDTEIWRTRGCMVDGRALQRRDGQKGIMYDSRVVFDKDPAGLPGRIMLFKWMYIPYETGVPYISNRWMSLVKKID